MELGGRRRNVAAVAVLGLALALGGCGGGGGGGGAKLSKSGYEKKLRGVNQNLNSLSSLRSSGSSPSAKLKTTQSAFRKAADDLSKVTPPGNVKNDNKELAAGLREMADELGPLADAAEKKDQTAAAAAVQKLRNGGLKKIQHAISDLKSKGYKNIG
jgi:hypothetical protein